MKLEEKLVSLRKAKGLSQMKLAEMMNIELALGREILVESSGLALFSDGDEVSWWATEALGSLTSIGLFKGTDVETIAPDDTISIEQAIILSYRSLSFIRSSEAT